MATVPLSSVERVSWDESIASMDWRPGEHVTLIGPTGRGKTEALVRLMSLRKWGVFLGTKRKDSTQERLAKMGFRTEKDARGINPEVANRFIFKPPFPRSEASALKSHHRKAFREALIRIRLQTGWTVGVDECRYISHFLGLSDELQMLWLQGRSEGTTIIANTQRPRFIPLEAYDQATHLLLWSDPDFSNVNRVSEMAGFNRHRVTQILSRQDKHDILYLNTVTGQMHVTNTRW